MEYALKLNILLLKVKTHTFEVYWNRFESKDGHDAVIETNFTKWAFLDEDELSEIIPELGGK